MVYIDEVEVDQEGIAEIMLDDSSIAQVARKCSIFHVFRMRNSLNVQDMDFLQVLEHHWDSLGQARVEVPVRLSGTLCLYMNDAHYLNSKQN